MSSFLLPPSFFHKEKRDRKDPFSGFEFSEHKSQPLLYLRRKYYIQCCILHNAILASSRWPFFSHLPFLAVLCSMNISFLNLLWENDSPVVVTGFHPMLLGFISVKRLTTYHACNALQLGTSFNSGIFRDISFTCKGAFFLKHHHFC